MISYQLPAASSFRHLLVEAGLSRKLIGLPMQAE
jgi:hypothetical protein